MPRDATESHRYRHAYIATSPTPVRPTPTQPSQPTPPPSSALLFEQALSSLSASLIAYRGTSSNTRLANSYAGHVSRVNVVREQQIAITAMMELAIERSGTGLRMEELYEVVRGVQQEAREEAACGVAPTAPSAFVPPSAAVSSSAVPFASVACKAAPTPEPAWVDALAARPKPDKQTARKSFQKVKEEYLQRVQALTTAREDAVLESPTGSDASSASENSLYIPHLARLSSIRSSEEKGAEYRRLAATNNGRSAVMPGDPKLVTVRDATAFLQYYCERTSSTTASEEVYSPSVALYSHIISLNGERVGNGTGPSGETAESFAKLDAGQRLALKEPGLWRLWDFFSGGVVDVGIHRVRK
ncbi:hypothetical protein P7C70_g1174, partial [Phenoliferia sp. Uapishka_3]